MSWKKETIEIPLSVDGGATIDKTIPVEVLAQRGIAIHKNVNADWNPKYPYNITHVASGRVVDSGIPTLREAKTIAKRLLLVTDWTQSSEEIQKHKQAVREAILA